MVAVLFGFLYCGFRSEMSVLVLGAVALAVVVLAGFVWCGFRSEIFIW